MIWWIIAYLCIGLSFVLVLKLYEDMHWLTGILYCLFWPIMFTVLVLAWIIYLIDATRK